MVKRKITKAQLEAELQVGTVDMKSVRVVEDEPQADETPEADKANIQVRS